MIQINAAVRLPPKMAHGTTFQNRSGRIRDYRFQLGCNRLRAVFHSGDIMKAGQTALDWRRHMKNIVDETGEIIAKATDGHTLIGGHHRLAVAASLGKKLFWKDTGEPVKLDPFFKGSSHRHTA
jgi:hypothetical protein